MQGERRGAESAEEDAEKRKEISLRGMSILLMSFFFSKDKT